MKMTVRGQITISRAIREKCGFAPNAEVEVGIKDGVVVVMPKHDMKDFDTRIKRTAVGTNILVDLVNESAAFTAASIAAMRRASELGDLD